MQSIVRRHNNGNLIRRPQILPAQSLSAEFSISPVVVLAIHILSNSK